MLTNAFQKREQAQYADKIKYLQTERDKASRELGQVKESLENCRRELSTIQEEKVRVKRELDTIGHDVIELKRIHDRYHLQNEGLASERGRLDQESKEKMKEYEKQITRLVKEISELETKKGKFNDIESYTKNKQEELRVTVLRLEKARDDLKLLEDKADVFRIDMSEKKAELESLINKNGIIMSENNKAFNILRIYVKRLQKYYDERGLKVNLIGQFKL